MVSDMMYISLSDSQIERAMTFADGRLERAFKTDLNEQKKLENESIEDADLVVVHQLDHASRNSEDAVASLHWRHIDRIPINWCSGALKDLLYGS